MYTVVVAPNLPSTERQALMSHFEEAALDPDYTIVTNYELRVDIIEPEAGESLVVIALAVPVVEIDEIRAAFKGGPSKYLSTEVENLIVFNFEITAFYLPLG